MPYLNTFPKEKNLKKILYANKMLQSKNMCQLRVLCVMMVLKLLISE